MPLGCLQGGLTWVQAQECEQGAEGERKEVEAWEGSGFRLKGSEFRRRVQGAGSGVWGKIQRIWIVAGLGSG